MSAFANLDIEPSFLPYLTEVVSARTVPLDQEDIPARRTRIASDRARKAQNVPPDIEVGRVHVPGPAGPIPVRVTRPRGRRRVPAIVHIHGGGWVYGSPDQSADLAISYARHVGAAVFAVGYRLAPEHPFPAAYEDCIAALDWLLDYGAAENIDTARVAITGESAGGNIAAAVALAAARAGKPLRLQLLNYPALDTDFGSASYADNADAPVLSAAEMRHFWSLYLGGDFGIDDERARPLIAQIPEGLAPAHVVVAQHDPLRNDGLAYVDKLNAAGIVATTFNAAGLTHGFLRAFDVSSFVAAIQRDNCARLAAALSADSETPEENS